MRLYAPDMDEFLGWMDSEGIRYAVLRNAPAFLKGWPVRGGKDDVDMLVDDGALDRRPAPIRVWPTIRRSWPTCCSTSVSGMRAGSGFPGPCPICSV
jgi:hypothetical protein